MVHWQRAVRKLVNTRGMSEGQNKRKGYEDKYEVGNDSKRIGLWGVERRASGWESVRGYI
jgi:hypothetical protein